MRIVFIVGTSVLLWVVTGVVVLLLVGCGSAVTPTIAPTLEPTPTPVPTAIPQRPTTTPIPPTPRVVYVEVTPTPPAEPTVVPTPTITPTPTPRPSPTAKYRPAALPDDIGYDGIVFSGTPSISNGFLSISAVIDRQGLEPTQVQVWHTLREDDLGSKCSTDQPIALIAAGSGSGVTEMRWEYCGNVDQRPLVYINDVPWVPPDSWSYNLRTRTYNFDPYTYDWSVRADLNDSRVKALDYDPGAGYIVIIFSGETILTKLWIDQ